MEQLSVSDGDASAVAGHLARSFVQLKPQAMSALAASAEQMRMVRPMVHLDLLTD